MLTDVQQKAIFTNIETVYTVDGTAYTAYKIYRDQWSLIVLQPTIVLNYMSRSKLEQDSIGRRAEYDSDILNIEVLATSDNTNGYHGSEISEFIMRDLETWIKESFDTDLKDYGVTATIYRPITDLSFLEEKIYRLHMEVKIFYKLI
jgi:hypothetical protein